jgi:hypothetical protein
MRPPIPETNKKPGVSYAFTNDGVELPFIDVTHPEFRVDLSPAAFTALRARFSEDTRRRAKMPRFLQRLMFRHYARKSVLLQGMVGASNRFLSGMSTYLMKLGPANIGDGYAGRIDKIIAASFPAIIIRQRMQNCAKLIASSVAGALSANSEVPLHLVNIAGGPAADSLNALLMLRKEHLGILGGRGIFVHVLDLEADAPEFGRRALESLQAPGAPLNGLKIAFEHTPFNWASPGPLRTLMEALGTGASVVAVSTEGGLFEYGSDAEVLGNLGILRDLAPPGTCVIGSVTRDDEETRVLHSTNRIPLHLRGIPVFTALAGRAGWTPDAVIEQPFSDLVRLTRSARGPSQD